jgi:hypothetical protein
MWRILRQIARHGILQRAAPEMQRRRRRSEGAPHPDELLAILGQALTIREVDAGSCNGCELEIHALNNPYYNLEGLGIKFVASPRHADMLLVTGPVTRQHGERAAPHLRLHAGSRSWWWRSATAAATAASSARATRAAAAWPM